MTKNAKFQTFRICYWLVVAILLAATTTMLFTYTPVEKTMGPIQKIFYVHLPAAINAFLGCVVAFVGGVGYLWQRKSKWDALSAAGAKLAAIMCSIVLLTGMIWGKTAWGVWWTWTPRLTFSLLLWLLYIVYLIIRPSIEQRQRRATICAVYAVVAFLNVPLVYLSARLIKEIHPSSVELAGPMKLTLAAWFVPVTLLTVGLMAEFFRSARRRQQKELEVPMESAWAVPTVNDEAKPVDDVAGPSGSDDV